LGIPGLIEAYKAAAAACCKQAIIVEQEESKIMELNVLDEQYYNLIKLLKNNMIAIVNSSYTEGKYFLKIEIPISKMAIIEPYV
jgi:putative IMPACT (imprinted ancient) family translation regulator